jgi:hypothetical protein
MYTVEAEVDDAAKVLARPEFNLTVSVLGAGNQFVRPEDANRTLVVTGPGC